MTFGLTILYQMILTQPQFIATHLKLTKKYVLDYCGELSIGISNLLFMYAQLSFSYPYNGVHPVRENIMKFGPELAEVINLTTQPYIQVSIKSLLVLFG